MGALPTSATKYVLLTD
ncbi:hypothetical protein FNU2_92 [Fusobacterium phage vB_FnuS_FNU2]|nr:hypothetical protein FNU2_92 [Fusobacterium phage vB_FnuS_FNU2]